jgi:hypothetical protein
LTASDGTGVVVVEAFLPRLYGRFDAISARDVGNVVWLPEFDEEKAHRASYSFEWLPHQTVL